MDESQTNEETIDVPIRKKKNSKILEVGMRH
jgi:hypothetical protein